jgi:hydroxyacylglutathione hydrolase
MSDLYLKQINVGPMKNFAYLIGSKSKKECYVVDPAWAIDDICKIAEAEDQKIIGALVTHYHPDHCGGHLWGHDIEGVSELVGKLNVPIYTHVDEKDGVKMVTGLSTTDIKTLRSGDTLSVGDVNITTIHTPGHTPGSQCFLVEQSLVSGDTLFVSGCGRVDLPGSSAEQMYESLTTKLAKLPKNTILYPGHHYDKEAHASFDLVLKKNPYLDASNYDAQKHFVGR